MAAQNAGDKQASPTSIKSAAVKTSPIYLSPTSRIRLATDAHRYSTSDDDSGCVMDEYAWVPSGLKPDAVHMYFSCLPGDKVPYINSVGEKWRLRQLQYQLPPQDSDVRYCGNLSEIEENELKIIEETRKRECLGRGVISRISFGEVRRVCHQCKSVIQPDELVVTAPERFTEDFVWHPQCFVCIDCNELLVDLIYYKHNENVFCGRHHAEQIKPRCAHCDELIFCEECTEAEGRVWHLKHFICVRCDCQLGGKRYIVRNDLPYCVPCYHLATELRCNTCQKDIIVDKPHITQGNIHWHADERCFCCAVCEKNLLGKKYCFLDNQLLCGVNTCAKVQEQEQKKAQRYFHLQRTGSSSSVPAASSSPSLVSLTPSGSASPINSDRPSSARNFAVNLDVPVQKSPSRVRFDLRPQQVPQSLQPSSRIERQLRPNPPKHHPPPPPANLTSEGSATTPPENIYETVVMPSQLSSCSSQELNRIDPSKKSKRRQKKRPNNNRADISVDYIISSDSSTDEGEGPCSSALLRRRQEEICLSPARPRNTDCKELKKECGHHSNHNTKHNHYTRGPPDGHTRQCSSCSSTSSDSDDAYLNEYISESLSRLQIQSNPKMVKSSLRSGRDIKSMKSIDDLVKPLPVIQRNDSNTNNANIEVGEALDRDSISMVLAEFSKRPTIRELAEENGISQKLFMKAFLNFRQFCMNVDSLDPMLKVTFADILTQGHSVDSLFVFFLAHARKIYPHLESLEDLKLISDLTQPHNWYPEARAIQRRIIFHAGPTNSGKTYSALERFKTAETGVYCGPLRLLANEIFIKMNEAGVPCDLATGEERCFAVDNLHPSKHLSSTVEMLSTQMPVEVAVIDEIQMLRDDQRGWAWTRALLGASAQEVHLCGERAAVSIVKKLLDPIGEHVEVREYERRSPLSISTHGLGDLRYLEDGDCLVCFSRRAIFNITKQLEKLGINCAVIYGDLPPGTKLAQAAKFNDPNDPVNVLVATDAVGMGLNLNIKRVIFNSLVKPPHGELIPTYAALQIAGRAGRYGTQYSDGKVMTMRNEDMGLLHSILSVPVEDIAKVGIAPTFEQIETFAYHLPHASFVNLLDIFTSICSVSDDFFICSVQQIRDLAELIDGINLSLKDRYTFCLVPIKPEYKVVAAAFVKMVRRYSTGQLISYDWFCDIINWPLAAPEKLTDLMHLEQIYDIVDAYLWLSLRFEDTFPDGELVRQIEKELDSLIQEGVIRLLTNQIDEKGESTNEQGDK